MAGMRRTVYLRRKMDLVTVVDELGAVHWRWLPYVVAAIPGSV
jgi:hypothetical protein